MKIRVIIAWVLVLSVFVSLAACGNKTDLPENTTETTAPTSHFTEEEEKILQARRDAVVAYMRDMLSVLWRADEDITYALPGGKPVFEIVKGRLYQGVPYAFTMGTKTSFLEYSIGVDENDIHTISGLSSESLNGESKTARIGADCSSAMTTAWSTVSPSLRSSNSYALHPTYNVLPVGEYEPVFNFVPNLTWEKISETGSVVDKTGIQGMYHCYAQLQKGDGIFYVGDSNHSRMIVSVDVVYAQDGKIDGEKSTVTVLEQSRKFFLAGVTTSVPGIDETVYVIGGLDVKYTFNELVGGDYLPVTIPEFWDPSPIAEPDITDSENQHDKDTILRGTISSNYYIDTVTITITDSTGKEIQRGAASVTRGSARAFDMQKFITDYPNSVRGNLALSKLKAGTYHCKTVCRLMDGTEYTIRDFDFTVK